MPVEKKVLYSVLPALSKDGKVRVGMVKYCEINLEEGIYWPDRSGAGDELIGTLRPTVQGALEQEQQFLLKAIRNAQKMVSTLQKKLEVIQAGMSDPTKVHISKRESP